jgi:glutathione synthase/RimK-type ligase-like ATP-grasp enzyme
MASWRFGRVTEAGLTRQRIETRQRVRLTVSGGVMSAALIESPRPDWRRDPAVCRYQVVTPVGVTRAARRLLAVLRLRHAALDFAVDRSGRWWFLEVNPTPSGNRGPVRAKGGRGGA